MFLILIFASNSLDLETIFDIQRIADIFVDRLQLLDTVLKGVYVIAYVGSSHTPYHDISKERGGEGG